MSDIREYVNDGGLDVDSGMSLEVYARRRGEMKRIIIVIKLKVGIVAVRNKY